MTTHRTPVQARGVYTANFKMSKLLDTLERNQDNTQLTSRERGIKWLEQRNS